MANPPATQDVNKWIETFSAFMAEEALKVLRKKTDDKGIEAYTAVTLSFLSRVLGNLVLDTLQDRPVHLQGDSEAMGDNALKTYGALKIGVQDAVSLAFTMASQHYFNKDISYYCEIKVEPPMLSKEVN